jgi:antitoxin HicB
MRYAFPCDIVRDEEEARMTGRLAYNVTFPDIPEAITCGWSWKEAVEMAEDVLATVLLFRIEDGEEIPMPGPLEEGQLLVPVPFMDAAKTSIYLAMREQGISYADLAARLDRSEDAVRKLVSPRYRSHFSQLEKALRAVGRSLVVEDESAVPPIPDHAREPSQAVLPVGAED